MQAYVLDLQYCILYWRILATAIKKHILHIKYFEKIRTANCYDIYFLDVTRVFIERYYAIVGIYEKENLQYVKFGEKFWDFGKSWDLGKL